MIFTCFLFFIGLGILLPTSIYVLISIYVDSVETKEMSVLICLLVSHVFGIVVILILGKIQLGKDGANYFDLRGNTFVKIKLIIVFTFGVLYIFHCGLYIWKPSLNNVNKWIGILSYVGGAIHIFLLLLYFAVFDKIYYNELKSHGSDQSPEGRKKRCQNALSILEIIFINFGSWIDTLWTSCLFKTRTDPTQNVMRAIEIIEKTKPLVLSAIIGFSLLTTDFLFPKTTMTFSESDLQTNETPSRQSVGSKNFMWSFIKTMAQHIFLLACFGFVAFTLIEILTSDPSADLKAYILTELSMKLLNLLIILTLSIIRLYVLCLYGKRSNISIIMSNYNVWLFMLILNCIGNISYHIACFFLDDSIHNENIKEIIYGDNIVSIILAVLQTLFIIGNYLGNIHENWDDSSRSKNCVYFTCSLLSMLNFGLMISDSIGKEGLIFKPYDCKVGNILKTMSLMFTIIFHFQTGVEFLKLYWHKKLSYT